MNNNNKVNINIVKQVDFDNKNKSNISIPPKKLLETFTNMYPRIKIRRKTLQNLPGFY